MSDLRTTYLERASGFDREARAFTSGRGLGRYVWLLADVWRQRRALSRLTADQLRDVGLSVNDVRLERAASWFDVPVRQMARLDRSRCRFWK